jgi:hypothetical protein
LTSTSSTAAVRPGGCLSLSDGGRRALNGRPTTSFEKGRRQAAKSLGGGRSSPTSPASRLPTPSTEGARVGSRPPQGNEDDRISVHRVHKVSSGRSARIEPSALCLKKLACCAVVARQRGEARRHELAPDRYLHLPAGWNRRLADVADCGLGRLSWADSDLWPNGRKAPGSGRTSVARERAESARSVSSLSLLNVRHILGRSATIAQRVGLREDERCAYGWLGAP